MNQFVIVRGRFRNGFGFMGPVPTKQQANEWLIPLHMDGDVMEILEPYGYTGEPGMFVLVIGRAVDGFEVVGTFSDRSAALDWYVIADQGDCCVVELNEYFQWKG